MTRFIGNAFVLLLLGFYVFVFAVVGFAQVHAGLPWPLVVLFSLAAAVGFGVLTLSAPWTYRD